MKKCYGGWYVGRKVSVNIDGMDYTRVVRDRRECGMYIVVNGIEHYEYEFEYANANERTTDND